MKRLPLQKVIAGVRISCAIEAIKHQYPHYFGKLPNINRIHATINRKT
jgi:ActR/RegA family two-component response regulator